MPSRSPYPKGHQQSPLERVNFVSEGSCRAILDQVVIPNLIPGPTGVGTGVVMCAGGKYLRYAYASLTLLRRLNPTIPVQIWYLGSAELPTPKVLDKFTLLNVHWVDSRKVMAAWHIPYFHPWNAKIVSIVYSHFRHVLLLDADCAPVIDPQIAFNTPEYQDSGAMFFPDGFQHRKTQRIFSMMGIQGTVDEHESGQILIDKNRHWGELALASWMNRHRVFYNLELGDKNIPGLAFAKLGTNFTQAPKPKWDPWGFTHYLPDGIPFTNHILSDKRQKVENPPEVVKLWEEYEA